MSESLSCHQCIEKICEQGCTVVREVISQLEDEQRVETLDHLSRGEREKVLTELKSIMSVYDNQ